MIFHMPNSNQKPKEMDKISDDKNNSFSKTYNFLLKTILLGSSLMLLFSFSGAAANSADRPIKPPKHCHHDSKCALYRSGSGGGMQHHRVKRLVNGTAGDIHAMPWMIYLSTLTWYSTGNRLTNCTGSLVSPRHVLTNAHCVPVSRMPNSSYTITVYYGSANKYTARSIVLPKEAAHWHPNVTTFLGNNRTIIVNGVTMVFRSSTVINDMAIVDLGQYLEIDDTVQPICVACLNNSTVLQGPAIIAGWGNIIYVCSGQPSVYPEIFNYQSVGVHQCITPEYEIANKVCTQADQKHGIGGGDSGSPVLASYNNGTSFLQVGVNGHNNCQEDRFSPKPITPIASHQKKKMPSTRLTNIGLNRLRASNARIFRKKNKESKKNTMYL